MLHDTIPGHCCSQGRLLAACQESLIAEHSRPCTQIYRFMAAPGKHADSPSQRPHPHGAFIVEMHPCCDNSVQQKHSFRSS